MHGVSHQLLIYASTESREIAKMTRGILFLGVPHHGSRYSLIARLMACTAAWRGSSTTLLEFVAQGNKELRTLDDRFARIYAGRGGHVSLVGTAPYIANLIETLPEGFGKLSLSPVSSLKVHLKCIAVDLLTTVLDRYARGRRADLRQASNSRN